MDRLYVMDASALLAVVFDEEGADAVLALAPRGALLSTVNWTEVLAKLVDHGLPVDEAIPRLSESGLLDAIRLVEFDTAQARAAAELRQHTRPLGLSLGDRACLALALLRGARAVTTDQVWLRVPGVAVTCVR
jgi:PIN domain nuclease of toxin-antitoxin system